MFLLLLMLVLILSLMLGAGPGLLALALSASGAVFVLPARGHAWLFDTTDVMRLVLFALEGLGVILLASVLRMSVRGLRDSPAAPERAQAAVKLIDPLTLREVEVLRLAATGLGAEAISELLVVSRNTIKTHLAHAYAKLGAHNRAEAIRAGLRCGYLDGQVLAAGAPEITLQGDARTPAHS